LEENSMLKISDNRRFLVDHRGTPFFYLADTAWELFHRLDLYEARNYLEDRAAKGFTVIQAVALAELDGLRVPNRNGDLPLIDLDPNKPNEAYFRHVDAVIELANSLGLTIALLPTWGDKWNMQWGIGPEVFTADNAYTFGLWLGKRYTDAELIWVVGGDRPINTPAQRDLIESMVRGLREGDQGKHLVTFHPTGQQCSSSYFHESDWLDFNMTQTGHARNRDNWRTIAEDYAREPIKPCLDAEPGYEDHPAGFQLENGYLDDYDVRKSLYWSLFAGAFGYTYGCHPVWQFWRQGGPAKSFARREWHEAMQLPGASQVGYARKLLYSRPYFSRIPDQSMIRSDQGEGTHHVQATRDAQGRYAIVYIPNQQTVTLDLSAISGQQAQISWINPRNGTSQQVGRVDCQASIDFVSPYGGPDWLLLIDSVEADYPPIDIR
jgi:hypothetical protein